jgi:hypothetical protein
VRAAEQRRLLETTLPVEKSFRVLRQRLESLAGWRRRSNRFPGLDEMRRCLGLTAPRLTNKRSRGVRQSLTDLAPEIFQDLAQPVRATLSELEATGRIESQEQAG